MIRWGPFDRCVGDYLVYSEKPHRGFTCVGVGPSSGVFVQNGKGRLELAHWTLKEVRVGPSINTQGESGRNSSGEVVDLSEDQADRT